MRIAFVSGNREKLPDAAIPLGVLYVMGSTPDHHKKKLIDLCFETHPVEALETQLEAFGPDLVALGIRNIQNNDYSGIGGNLDYYADLVSAVRRVSSAPIVLGGGGFSVMPSKMMARLLPDYGISGEAEHAFSLLVEALEKPPAAFAGIDRLLRFDDGELIASPADSGFLDMNALPVPDRALVDPRYYEHYGIESVQTKRGCPLRCDYCTYPLIEGRVGRKREPPTIVDEMFQALQVHPETHHFFIVDSVFNLPKNHAKEVCHELIRRGWTLPWTCYANPLGFDREMAELARAAGCAGMEIGTDSGCNEILERLRKGFTVDQVRSLHQICLDVGIPDCHTFILGTQGETLDHVHRTLDFVVDLDPFSAILMIWIDDNESVDPALRKERTRLRAQIEEVLVERKQDYTHWIIPSLEINFDPDLFCRLRRNGFRGPLWQHIRRSPIATKTRTRRQLGTQTSNSRSS